ncbi:MAG: hypothetical protein KAG97_05135 [Victivallales bacterium]|nr:hypothetical protein [Victivallales bacterium]
MILFGNILAIVAIVALVPVAFAALYYLALACYSLLPARNRGVRVSGNSARFAVTIYARNAEEKTAEAIKRLMEGLDYDRSKYEVVVIADSCDDSTAYIASFNGAKVLERRNEWKIGFSFAMEWAIPILIKDGFDAIFALDIDSVPLSKTLKYLDTAISEGYRVAQVPLVHTGERSFSAGIADAARNRVNPTGRSNSGFSCGLYPLGFCITKELLVKTPFVATEADNTRAYSSKLVFEDEPVAFLSKTAVLVKEPFETVLKPLESPEASPVAYSSGKMLKAAFEGNPAAFERICGGLAPKAGTLLLALIVEMLTGVVLVVSGTNFTQYASLLQYGRFIVIVTLIASAILIFHLTVCALARYSDSILKKAINY